MSLNLTVASINARGLRNKNKRQTLYKWFTDNNVTIAFIQETYFDQKQEHVYTHGCQGKLFNSYTNSNHSRGVSIYVNSKLKCEVKSVEQDTLGRKIMIKLCISGSIFTFVNMYCPNVVNDRVAFLNQCITWINNHCVDKSKLIVGGDFNCVYENVDRTSKVLDKSSVCFKQFMNEMNLIDSWRIKHDGDIDFTYIDPSHRGLNSRIDYILIPLSMQQYLMKCDHRLAPTPDHKAVTALIKSASNPSGKGYWKLNVSILDENDYVIGDKSVIDKTITDYDNDLCKSKLWELIKIRIKEFSIKYCQIRSKKRKDEMLTLENKINLIDSSIAIGRDNIEELHVEHKVEKRNYKMKHIKNLILQKPKA